MNFSEEYQHYLTAREHLLPLSAWVEYDWAAPQDPLYITYLAYSQMLNEHPREIANSINQLQRLTLSLKAWDQRLRLVNDEQHKLNIICEFVDPISIVAINLPYVIRSRFIYSTTHLSHQANQSRCTDWKDDLTLDSEIYFEHADKYGAYWRSYNALKLALEKISSGNYIEATINFRHKYNHRYSPKIEIGLTGLVTRHVNKPDQVTYCFGYTEPLKLSNVVSALEKQHECCLKAFSRYKSLIKEQVDAIEAHNLRLQP